MIGNQLLLILFLGFLCFIAWRIAWIRGFFKSEKAAEPFVFSLKFVIILFVVFLAVPTLISPLLMKIITRIVSLPPYLQLTYSQIMTTGLTLIGLFSFSYWRYGLSFLSLFKKTHKADALFGALSYLVAFPFSFLVGQIVTLLNYLVFGVVSQDQKTVAFLKRALEYPVLFITMGLAIIIAAPLIEEFLFRGILQNYLKRYLSVKKAIVLTSIFFALFHYSFSLKLNNLPILASLFTLSLFLGFIAEKKRGLTAPIALHMTFNFISVAHILLINIFLNAILVL